jgi:hypothetical protein
MSVPESASSGNRSGALERYSTYVQRLTDALARGDAEALVAGVEALSDIRDAACAAELERVSLEL